MQVSLWEIGILLIGLGIFVACIYGSKLISKATETIINLDRIILNNEKEINNITSNMNDITTSAVSIADNLDKHVSEMDASVQSINKTTESLATVVGSTTDKLITPSLDGINKLIVTLISYWEARKKS